MQLDLLGRVTSQARTLPGAGPSLTVFGASDRVEAALREGTAALDVMLFDDLLALVCEHALRCASASGLRVWYAGRRRATEVELEAVIRRVARDLYRGGQGVYAQVARRSGFISALEEFYIECREGNASSAVFWEFVAFCREEAGGADEHRAGRIEELARLLERYEEALEALKLLDPGLTLRVALEALHDPRVPLPPALHRQSVHFRNIHDWSPIRVDLARALARRLSREAHGGGKVENRVEIHLPYDFDRPNLFHYLEPILRQLESLDGEALTLRWHTAGELWLMERPLERLAESVWRSAERVGASLGEVGELAEEAIEDLGPGALQVIEAPGARREARAVARRVRELMEAGAAPDEIFIAPRALDESIEPICEQLDVYGVPWHCGWGEPLSAAPPARLALALVRLVLDNFPREAFVEVLTSPYVAGGVSQGEVAPHELGQLLREAGVRDDLSALGLEQSAYEERLSSHLAQVKARLERGRRRRQITGGPSPGDEIPLEAHPEVQRVGRLCERVLWLRRELSRRLPAGRRRLGEHAEGLRALLGVLRVEEAIARGASAASERPGDDPVLRRALRAQARDQHAWRALTLLLEDLVRVDGLLDGVSGPTWESALELEGAEDDDGLLGLGEFIEALTHLMGRLRLPVPGARGGAVRLVPVHHLAGMEAPHVIIPGLTQGRFPATLRSRALFGDEDRIAFGRFEAARRRQRGVDGLRMSFPLQCIPYRDDVPGWTPVPARQSEEVLLFYFGLAAAMETLTLCSARRDDSGREAVRSVFIDEVLRRTPREVREAVCRDEALDPVPAAPDCVARWELLARYQLEANGDAILPRPVATALNEVERALSGRGVDVGAIERAALIERRRHEWSALGPDELMDEVASAREYGRYCGELGHVHGAWLDEALAFGPGAPLVASMLDRFGACPQKFYFADLLHLQARQVTTQDVSAGDRHEAVERMMTAAYDALDEAGLLPLGRGDEEARQRALEVAAEAMGEALRRWEEVHHRAHPRLWQQVRAVCEELVQQLIVREQDGQHRQQVALPWAFGQWQGERAPSRPPVPVELAAGMTVHLAGKVDRVLQGRMLGAGDKLELVSYGTGPLLNYERRLEEGALYETEFTMPVALLAVAEGLVPELQERGAVGGQVMVSAHYESLLEGKASRALYGEVGGVAPLQDDHVARARFEIADEVARMRQGSYPFATRDCAWCQFRAVCRRGTYPDRGGEGGP